MQIHISGKSIDTGDALRTHVTDKLNDTVGKYFDTPVDAHVVFSKEGFAFRCDTQVHLSSGMILQARADAGEIYSAFDNALERMEKRLRRYKRRLKSHHNDKAEAIAFFDAPSFVIQPEGEEGSDEPETLEPVVIAEGTERVPSLTVGAAVMAMELQESPVLLFKNSAHGGLNLVYRREDGNVGWIDLPQDAKSN